MRFGDAIAILLIVALNAVLGFYQERRAEAALDALQKMQTPNARVRRGDEVKIVAGVRARGRATSSSSRRATPSPPTRASSRRSTSPPRRPRSPARASRSRRTRARPCADDAPLGDRVDDALRRHDARARQGPRGGRRDRARAPSSASSRRSSSAPATGRRRSRRSSITSASASSGRASRSPALLFARGHDPRATAPGTSCCSRR